MTNTRQEEFVGLAVIACGLAVFIASIVALLQYRERAAMAEQLESWQRQEWIDNLIDMRRQELASQIKHKPS